MSQIGRYEGGAPFVILPAGGVRITSATPASTIVADRKMHGLERVNLALLTEDLPAFIGPRKQGADSRVCTPYLFVAYDNALNLDPGNTGVPLTITTPGSYVKYVSRAEADISAFADTYTKFRAPVFFINHTPVAGSLPPPLGAPAVVSKFVKTDINFALLPAVTLPGSAPSASNILGRYRWLQQLQTPNRSAGDWLTSHFAEGHYGSVSASERGSALLLMCCDLTALGGNLKELLAIHTVIHAQNLLEAAKTGAVYNFNSGLGGILPGYKPLLMTAGLLTGNAEMLEWTNPALHDIWAEDRQMVYVSAGDVATYDYVDDDLNMPEWQINPVKAPTSRTRVLTPNYRATFRSHQFATAALARLLPGGVAAWNHPPFFDYCERLARRTVYKDPLSQLAWGFMPSLEYQAPQFHKDMYLAHVPAGWNWPA